MELAQTYTRRWPVQENIIRDFLLPLGLDTNHGYGKTPIVNSEVAKKRAALEKRLSNVQRWTASTQVRCHKASVLYDRLWKQTKSYGDELYRKLNAHQDALATQGVNYYERRAQIKEQKAVIDAELVKRWQRVWRELPISAGDNRFRLLPLRPAPCIQRERLTHFQHLAANALKGRSVIAISR